MRAKNVSPKLLLEFYKGEKVPALVKKDDDRNSLTPHKKSPPRHFRSPSVHSTHSTLSKKTVVEQRNRYDEQYRISQQMHHEREQNQELRKAILQLSEKSEALQKINEKLMNRITEIEKQMKSDRENYDLEKKSMHLKIKNSMYEEIQDYLRFSIEKFMESLKREKMSPIVEGKIEGFLEEIININEQSVARNSRSFSPKFSSKEVDRVIKEITHVKGRDKSLERSYKKKEISPSRVSHSKYQTIFEKLNKMSPKEEEEDRRISLESDRSRNSRDSSPLIVHPSPQQSQLRPRIFNKKYATDIKRGGRRIDWNQ